MQYIHQGQVRPPPPRPPLFKPEKQALQKRASKGKALLFSGMCGKGPGPLTVRDTQGQISRTRSLYFPHPVAPLPPPLPLSRSSESPLQGVARERGLPAVVLLRRRFLAPAGVGADGRQARQFHLRLVLPRRRPVLLVRRRPRAREFPSVSVSVSVSPHVRGGDNGGC